MGIVETRTFKSGNSVAVRLPRQFGVSPGVAVTIENSNGVITIRAAEDPDRVRSGLADMAREIAAAWAGCADREIEVRDPDIFPDRPGL